TYAGPLAEAQLGLEVYHVLEEEIRNAIPEEVWEDQIGVMADVLEVDEIAAALRPFRDQAGQ
ncbi:MAG: glycine/sarcosine/betaine reductase complex selenoprotein A, partial [Actinomycetota bacterium]